MNLRTVLEVYQSCGSPCRRRATEIDEATGTYQNMRHVKPPEQRTAGFSLVEVTLALGVAALCLIVLLGLLAVGVKTQQASMQQTTANDIMSMILGDLRADVRLPPGQYKHYEEDSGFGLHGHWAHVLAPDTIYFTNQAKMTGNLNATTAPPDAAFKATVSYLFPPNVSTSVATVTVSWPAAAPSTAVPAGSLNTFIAVNR